MTKFRIVGPLMCGDSRLLDMKRNELRPRLNIGWPDQTRYISVFDIPSVSARVLSLSIVGLGVYGAESAEVFFECLAKILEEFTDVCLIFKLKRPLNSPHLEYSPAMLRLIDPNGLYRQEQKVVVLGHDTDPYFAVALADICVGFAFVSPLFVGLSVGKPCFFYNFFNTPASKTSSILNSFCVFSPEDFMTRLKSCLAAPVGHDRKNQVSETDIDALAGPRGDPQVRFAQMILNEKQELGPRVANG